ncbi:hypothetical protein CRE_16219 [Caenorhabditis remanei]|uniref:DUF281 domain-containing protein n=1 Tax=Caenorhabditis remanei TaxID=31234 RepID=E3MSM6_CAERE|nr:hypothetical protein CRE_16219 [Caenorhabditis remanei]
MIPPEEVSISTEPPVTDTPITDEPTNACKTCDISKIAPTNPLPGTSFESEENIVTGCLTTTVTCKRDDGQICSSVAVQPAPPATSVNLLQKLYQMIPVLYQIRIENGCQVITVTCQRDDGLICSSIAVRASFKDQIGTVEVGSTTDSGSGFGLLECNSNGIITYNGADEITELFCEFVDCPPPSCTSCDLSTIASTVPPAGTSIIPQENTVNGCKEATITCQREDGQICTSVAVQATTAGGTSDIATDMSTGLATAQLTCTADGRTKITKFTVKFTNCAA